MLTENKMLMQKARESLAGNWGLGVKTILVYFLATVVAVQIVSYVLAYPFHLFIGSNLDDVAKNFSDIIGIFYGLLVGFGLSVFFLSFSRGTTQGFGYLFYAFNNKKRYSNILLIIILRAIYTFLWTLLLIIPGIIAWYSYSQALYIYYDDESIRPSEALSRSKKLIAGNKMKLLYLNFRFFGWMILSIFTLGIGLLWLIPYMQVATAKFYDDLKNQPTAVGVTPPPQAQPLPEVPLAPQVEQVQQIPQVQQVQTTS